jgi:GNAT superfamily N-acetyltransferase
MSAVAVPAGKDDIEPLGDVLQAAFFDDPVISWIFPDERSRARRAAGMFRSLLQHHYLSSHTVWTTPDQVGGALWSPPGHWKLTTREILRTGLPMLSAMGRRAIPSLRLLDYIDKQHPEGPHWYLGILGTSPAHQGKGVGAALMQPVLERCDREGLPAYLESSKETNIPFYARHGFVVTGEITPPGGPTLWPMWREPQAEKG